MIVSTLYVGTTVITSSKGVEGWFIINKFNIFSNINLKRKMNHHLYGRNNKLIKITH